MYDIFFQRPDTYSLNERTMISLTTVIKSVGMIYYDASDGSPQAVGTVFRCGTHYAMTAYHVIQLILGRSRNANLAPLHFSFVSHQGYINTGTFDEVIKFCKISFLLG